MSDLKIRSALLAALPILLTSLAAAAFMPAHGAAKTAHMSAQAQSLDCDPLDPVCPGYVYRG